MWAKYRDLHGTGPLYHAHQDGDIVDAIRAAELAGNRDVPKGGHFAGLQYGQRLHGYTIRMV
jgi:hypothetical protein